jgi:riboflavin biosynthesis pyrimidine reductase
MDKITDNILRLFPEPTAQIPFIGAYLRDDIRKIRADQNKPFVYANFITSLDGRIAVERQAGRGLAIPKETVNERDWRLFQELAAQADIIISSGRYLRDWSTGKAQEILRVDNEQFADLREWRREQGLPPHPDIVVLSHQLDFTIPEVLQHGGRKAIVFTDPDADRARIDNIWKQISNIQIAEQGGWGGKDFVNRLFDLGYRTIYSAAGPKILHMLLTEKALDRQYLTLVPRMLGGERFSTLLEGSLIHPPVSFALNHIYLDKLAFDGAGQLFLSYDSDTSSSKID